METVKKKRTNTPGVISNYFAENASVKVDFRSENLIQFNRIFDTIN